MAANKVETTSVEVGLYEKINNVLGDIFGGKERKALPWVKAALTTGIPIISASLLSPALLPAAAIYGIFNGAITLGLSALTDIRFLKHDFPKAT